MTNDEETPLCGNCGAAIDLQEGPLCGTCEELPEWQVEVSWTMTAIVTKRAKTLEAACVLARHDSNLPDGEYLDGSFEADLDMSRNLNMTDEETANT